MPRPNKVAIVFSCSGKSVNGGLPCSSLPDIFACPLSKDRVRGLLGPKSKAEEEPETKELKHQDVINYCRTLTAQKVDAEAIRAVIKGAGVNKVAELKLEQLGDLMNELKKLGGE